MVRVCVTKLGFSMHCDVGSLLLIELRGQLTTQLPEFSDYLLRLDLRDSMS